MVLWCWKWTIRGLVYPVQLCAKLIKLLCLRWCDCVLSSVLTFQAWHHQAVSSWVSHQTHPKRLFHWFLGGPTRNAASHWLPPHPSKPARWLCSPWTSDAQALWLLHVGLGKFEICKRPTSPTKNVAVQLGTTQTRKIQNVPNQEKSSMLHASKLFPRGAWGPSPRIQESFELIPRRSKFYDTDYALTLLEEISLTMAQKHDTPQNQS